MALLNDEKRNPFDADAVREDGESDEAFLARKLAYAQEGSPALRSAGTDAHGALLEEAGVTEEDLLEEREDSSFDQEQHAGALREGGAL